MPWVCKGCQAPVAFDSRSECPSCGLAKAAWTMEVDRTRAMTVRSRKLRLLTQRGEELVPAQALPALDHDSLALATQAGTFSLEQGLLLRAPLRKRGGAAPRVRVSVLHGGREAREQELELALSEAGDCYERRVAFVWGELPERGPEGVELVGLGELESCAAVEFSLGKRKPLELEPAWLGSLRVALVDPDPAVEEAFVLLGPEDRVYEARVFEPEPRRLLLVFAGVPVAGRYSLEVRPPGGRPYRLWEGVSLRRLLAGSLQQEPEDDEGAEPREGEAEAQGEAEAVREERGLEASQAGALGALGAGDEDADEDADEDWVWTRDESPDQDPAEFEEQPLEWSPSWLLRSLNAPPAGRGS